MTCAEFDRWLDEGMAEDVSATALAHAHACARCSATLEAARAVETALLARQAPLRAPAGLAPSVMARVRALEVADTRELVKESTPRWWVALLTDPIASVSLTIALLALAMMVWSPAWTLRIGQWIGARWLIGAASPHGLHLEPTTWAALAVVACPFVTWWIYELVRGLERGIVLYLVRSGR